MMASAAARGVEAKFMQKINALESRVKSLEKELASLKGDCGSEKLLWSEEAMMLAHNKKRCTNSILPVYGCFSCGHSIFTNAPDTVWCKIKRTAMSTFDSCKEYKKYKGE